MRIFKYFAHSRPSCVEDGGYAYDQDTGYCLGFGTQEDETYEITIEQAVSHYNSLDFFEGMDEFGNQVTKQSAEDFLKDHKASSSDLAVELLEATDQTFIRVTEDLIETLVNKSIISVDDLPEIARNKLVARQNLRSLI
jgi:hypothetical protein